MDLSKKGGARYDLKMVAAICTTITDAVDPVTMIPKVERVNDFYLFIFFWKLINYLLEASFISRCIYCLFCFCQILLSYS